MPGRPCTGLCTAAHEALQEHSPEEPERARLCAGVPRSNRSQLFVRSWQGASQEQDLWGYAPSQSSPIRLCGKRSSAHCVFSMSLVVLLALTAAAHKAMHHTRDLYPTLS
eukprot:TRINITY_DN50599_c0_g1_i1.p2 TRINITY_DN50599_c0_g1~~TRINITY_DN50599_c0_g1_i1.p2  ORF type:complete len:110 (-),score=4.43 TRINITY_DN50599_c0_g1_i1:302-631(-)